MSKALSPDEIRDDFMATCRNLAYYWANIDKPKQECLFGLVHSLLVLIDGQSGLPAFDLVARPHPDDKQYFIDEGSDWIEDGTVINAQVLLHELLH